MQWFHVMMIMVWDINVCQKKCMYNLPPIINPFPHTDAFWRLSSRRLLKHCDKRRNCSKRAISPFATLFQFLFSYSILINRYCPYFCCCGFVVCGKGLTIHFLTFLNPWPHAAAIPHICSKQVSILFTY